MLTDKELKVQFKQKCKADPEQHYPVKTLKDLGFYRQQCSCGTFFWSVNPNQKVCGDAACSGGFRFINNSPAKNKLDYVETWQKFSKMFEELGYTPVKRYPVVARWNPTTDFTIASIAAFQPFVVTGEVAPPANPLVIPQFCVRFGDIDNVGITGSHYTGFVMIGQHAFVQPKEYDINKYLSHIHKWLSKGIGLKDEEITFHEDAWAGGGNCGPSMEFFSRGLELGNQVYMQYEQTEAGIQELKIKVLDMGMGHERVPWFTQGKSTSYETTFPTVAKKLQSITGVKIDAKLMAGFLPKANMLNVDEVSDVEKAWENIAKSLKVSSKELKGAILPLAAQYAIADHARSLLFTINDGALPSNVGGMYNLRVIARRAFEFIEKYGWNIDLCDVCEWHAEYLKPLFPELKENIESVRKILEVEKIKYLSTKQKVSEILGRVLSNDVTTDKLIELYDSQGVSPALIAEEAKKQDKVIKIPDNFYALIAARHEQKPQEHATEREEKIGVGDVPATEALYFDDWKLASFEAKVLKIVGNHVILDKTAFYPVSGGQMHDIGMLSREKVIDVFKQGKIIIHKLEEPPKFKEGNIIKGEIDFERRKQLAQHHTATHIVNAAARQVLGRHINQAGAKKDVDKAYIDLTHYQPVSGDELKQIEKVANDIVKKSIKTNKTFLPRTDAEKKYGMRIYQGGAVPGKLIRIMEIPDIDVQACGGTHLNNTSETEKIILLNTTKVKDGVVRIYFCAGKAADGIENLERNHIEEISKILRVPDNQIPARAQELFEAWKKARKLVNKGEKTDIKQFDLSSKDTFDGDVLKKTSEILNTQVEYIAKSLQRFLNELELFKKQLK
ncbi:alanine--tRNA ligase [Candidatus Woesearchaeota archaeon]|nr:alanine--tRNA ligase [Candidatus Woesearchaeota archaeon]